MANTVSYSASMRTRKTNSASNAKSSAASQEYYENTYNYVGIVHFAGMALSGKVITGISLRVVAAQAGYGTGHTKTVYVRKANYQSASQSGITGLGYCGDALGTFTGAFYGNTSTYTLSGDLLNNLAAYIAEGNNTICLYNPNPVKSSQGYSTNYLQWSECTITVTYEEAASKPTLNKYSLAMGTAVTIYTNRQSSIATHTVRYSFFSESGLIAVGVEDVCAWTPPISLAAQIPNAISGWGTVLCDTYVNGNLVSTNTCAFQLTVPASVAPSISNVAFSEATSGIADRFGGYVLTRSKLSVSITATGAQGSSISAYRTSIDNVTYAGASFTTNTLITAGSLTMTVTVTDSRGRSASTTRTVIVLDYSPPSLSQFTAERCNADGTAAQTDGTKVRISAKASGSSVGSKNTLACTVYYKLSSAESWVSAVTLAPSNYVISETNRLLSPTFDALSSYDIKIRVQDAFDFDTGFAAMLCSKLLGKKLIYHILDYYVEGHILPGRLLKNVIERFEVCVINASDATVICTEKRRVQIDKASPKKIYVIHNTPNSVQVINESFKLQSKNSKVKIAYVGILAGLRLLKETVEVIAQMDNVEMHIGGFGEYEKWMKEAADKYDNIFFYGKLQYTDTLSLEKQCDIMTAIYDPSFRNHKYAAPNKFYESIMLGKPIIMARDTGYDDVIEPSDIGILTEYSKDGIASAINKLNQRKQECGSRTPHLRYLLSLSGRVQPAGSFHHFQVQFRAH